MPYYRTFYHLVWSTKNRLPGITPDIEKRLYPYLERKAHELGCRIIAAGGWIDHVHLVVSIPPKLSISTVMKRLKGAASHEFPELYWQRGYGVLTVGERNLDIAVDYVNRQKEHHQQHTAVGRLERCDDDPDEGSPSIREESVEYQTAEELLF